MRILIGVLLVLTSFQIKAFNFTLTEREFSIWDERCKMAFAASGAGRRSGFYPNMTAERNKEVREFAEAAGGAWHYCAGLILLQRAYSATGKEREENLTRAGREIKFTVVRIPQENQWYPEIYVDYARAQYLNNNKIDAFITLQQLITTHPSHSLAYTALAYYLKKENKLDQAITTLQNAPELLKNESAELNYFLGWYLMEANDSKAALEYAKRAYALNYPVPTLRQRLAAKGLSW